MTLISFLAIELPRIAPKKSLTQLFSIRRFTRWGNRKELRPGTKHVFKRRKEKCTAIIRLGQNEINRVRNYTGVGSILLCYLSLTIDKLRNGLIMNILRQIVKRFTWKFQARNQKIYVYRLRKIRLSLRGASWKRYASTTISDISTLLDLFLADGKRTVASKI